MRKTANKLFALCLTAAMVVSTAGGSTAGAAGKKAELKLSKTSVSLEKGKKVTLKVSKKNVKKVKSQTWSSNSRKVATVSKKGVVTAKKAGKATVTCKVTYLAKGAKKYTSKSLKCKVTVKSSTKPAATPAATPTPSLDPNTTFDKALEAKDITLRVKLDKTTNIGEEREVTIGDKKMKVKDNGVMRKDLSSQYLVDNEMGQGANLGNTMEATLDMDKRSKATDISEFETAWGQPVTTQKYIDCLSSYGINTLRIPVAWTNMDKDDGTYTISEKQLSRVEQIVNYALNDGMYVVINDHWDNGWWGQFGACKYDAEGNKVADEERRAEAWKRYEAYWTQIANRFKNYSDHVILESANEELGSRLNDRIYSNGYSSTTDADDKAIGGNLKKDAQYEMTNKINQKFVDIVRSTGGNNTYRHLLIAGFNTNIGDTADDRFKMPTDSANTDVNKLFLSVHYYTPWDFCGDGGTGDYTVADQEYTKKEFENLKKFSDAGYGIIIGECGIVNPTGVTSSVSQWFHDMFTEAQKYHAVPVLWETSNYFDRSAAKIKFKDIAVFYNTVTGSNGDTSVSRVTGKIEMSDIMSIDGMTPAWSWTGKWYKNGGDNIVGDDKFQENGGTVVVAGGSDEDRLKLFVPESKVTTTIKDDATSISFNNWGYQAFLKVDTSKYKNPAIAFDFLAGTDNEDNVMSLVYGASGKDQTYANDVSVDYAKYHGKAVLLTEACGYSAEKPYICIAFGGKPIVTGIHIYEMGQ